MLIDIYMKFRQDSLNSFLVIEWTQFCDSLYVLRFYGPVNPMRSCPARSVYLATRLLDRLSPLSG